MNPQNKKDKRFNSYAKAYVMSFYISKKLKPEKTKAFSKIAPKPPT